MHGVAYKGQIKCVSERLKLWEVLKQNSQ